MSATELQRAVDALASQVEAKSDAISMIESQLLEDRIRKSLLPTSLPIEAQWNASAYGWRVDPFTGERALHEGVDFVAPIGTNIAAAASGVVVSAERHPQYGNLVEIDHGNDLTTRYAHASKILVKPGQLRPGRICISKCGFVAWRRTPIASCAWRKTPASRSPNRRSPQSADPGGLSLPC